MERYARPATDSFIACYIPLRFFFFSNRTTYANFSDRLPSKWEMMETCCAVCDLYKRSEEVRTRSGCGRMGFMFGHKLNVSYLRVRIWKHIAQLHKFAGMFGGAFARSLAYIFLMSALVRWLRALPNKYLLTLPFSLGVFCGTTRIFVRFVPTTLRRVIGDGLITVFGERQPRGWRLKVEKLAFCLRAQT